MDGDSNLIDGIFGNTFLSPIYLRMRMKYVCCMFIIMILKLKNVG